MSTSLSPVLFIAHPQGHTLDAPLSVAPLSPLLSSALSPLLSSNDCMVDHRLLESLLPASRAHDSSGRVVTLEPVPVASPLISESSASLTHLSPASAIAPDPIAPLHSAPLAYLSAEYFDVQSTQEGDLKTVPSVVQPNDRTAQRHPSGPSSPYWRVRRTPAGDHVYLVDPHGRYLASGLKEGDMKGNILSLNRRIKLQLVQLRVERGHDCRWWLTPEVQRIERGERVWERVVVRACSAEGPVLQRTFHDELLCGAPPSRWSASPTLVLLELALPPACCTITLWGRSPERRSYSRFLERHDEVAAMTVRVVSLDAQAKGEENVVTAMPDGSVLLTAASAAAAPSPLSPPSLPLSSGVDWQLIRTQRPGVVYLRAADGLYLTASWVRQELAVFMAPKCEASAWQMETGGEGGDVGVTLCHCSSRWYLQAKPRWSVYTLTTSRQVDRCTPKVKHATRFSLLASPRQG